MRVCFWILASVGWLSLARGFTTASSRRARTAVARYAGWDNDNFLDSLGKGADDQEEANDAYFGMSRYGRPEEQQQRPPPGFGGRRSSGTSGPPSASNFAMEADDGYDEAYAQQFTQQQQPSGMGQSPPTNQFTPPPPQGGPPPQAISPPQAATNIQQPGGVPPDQYAQHLTQLSQQLAQLAQQQQQLLQSQQFAQPYGQPQQPPPQQQQPVQQPTLGQPAQAQNSQQISMQQILEQFQQQQQPPQTPPQQQQQQPLQMGQDSTVDPTADRKDELPEGDIEGAVLTEEMKAKAKYSHNPQEEASQGGELFRSMMARAKQRAGQQQTIAQPQQQPMIPPPQQQGVQIPANAMDLSIEEQARLFRDIMADRQQQVVQAASSPQNPYQQQQPQQWSDSSTYAQQQLPTYPYGENSAQPQFLPPGVGIDGRKIGRNRDADIIATSADVYFAQLKRDSSTRRLAREAGDNDKANEVFHDPSIQEIKAPPANPYMVEQRAKERDMLESPPEEMLNFQEYNKKSDATQDRSYSGISFKEKLAQKRAQKKAEQGDNNNK